MNAIVTVLLLAGTALCMLAVAFFAGVESGMLNMSRARLMSLAKVGAPRASRLADSVSDMPRVINTVLVGTNLFSVLASTLSAAAALRISRSAWFSACWSAAVAMAVLFGCEYLPKLLFTSRPLRRMLQAAPVYRFAEKTLWPLVAVFQWLVKALFRTPSSSRGKRLSMSRDGLRTLVADKVNGARLTDFERRLIERVLALQAHFADEIMTPVDRIAKVRETTRLAECVAMARSSGQVFLPVFAADGRKVTGMLDVISLLRISGGAVPEGIASEAAQRPLVIDSRMRADDILPLMRRRRTAFAVVEDASKEGRAVGILAEENVLMAMVG